MKIEYEIEIGTMESKIGSFEIDDLASEKDIENEVMQIALEFLDWSWVKSI